MKKVIYAVGAFLPSLALAQNQGPQTGTLTGLVNFVYATIQKLIPIIFGLAIVYFFYGLAKFIRSAGDPKAQGEGKAIMIYGVIALAVMVSVYGLIGWLQGTFGVNAAATVSLPTV